MNHLFLQIKSWASDIGRRATNWPLVGFWGTLALRVGREMTRDDATHLAAGVAYFAIFSIFPILLGFMAIGGVILNEESARQEFLQGVSNILPGSDEFIDTIIPVVEQNVGTLVAARGPLGLISLAGILWSSTAVFAAISRAVDRAWDIPYNRPYLIAKGRQVFMVLAMGVPFLLSTIATSITSSLSRLTEFNLLNGWLGGGFAGFILSAVDWGLIFLVFLVAYRFVPNTKTHWRYVWLGAVVAAVLFLSGRYIFIWYLGNWARYDTIYGPVSSIMVFLFWTYISALILVLGAEISSEYERLRLAT